MNDCGGNIPWNNVGEYSLTISYFLLLILASSLFAVRYYDLRRKKSRETSGETVDVDVVQVFLSSMKGATNTSAFVLHAMILAYLEPRQGKGTMPMICEPSIVNMYVFSAMIITNSFLVEIVAKGNISMAGFFHHFVSVFLFIMFVSGGNVSKSEGSNSLSPFFEQDEDWQAYMLLGTIAMMFASSAFIADWMMVLYHLCKKTRPSTVFKCFGAMLVVHSFARLALHIFWFIQYANVIKVNKKSGYNDWTLYVACPAAIIIMVTEYYLTFVLFQICINHKKRRLDTNTNAGISTEEDLEEQKEAQSRKENISQAGSQPQLEGRGS